MAERNPIEREEEIGVDQGGEEGRKECGEVRQDQSNEDGRAWEGRAGVFGWVGFGENFGIQQAVG